MWASQLFGLPKPCVSTGSVVHQGGISASLVMLLLQVLITGLRIYRKSLGSLKKKGFRLNLVADYA